jgi:hypothetical protein
MSRFIRFLLSGLSVLAGLAGAWPAQAQNSAIALASLQIDLWPEFDKPSVLVLLTGTLDAEVPLPADVTVRIPAASGQPSAVAVSSNNQLVNAPYTSTVAGDQILITFQADSTEFRVEYYDPAMTITGQARDYSFHWTTDYPVRAANIHVQEPVGATQLAAEPAVTLAGPGDNGLNYYTAALGALGAGQLVNLHLTYSRASNALSASIVSQNAAPAVAPGPAPAVPAAGVNWYFVWAGVLAALLVAGGSGYWYFTRRGQGETESHRSRRRARPLMAEAHPSSRSEGQEAGPDGPTSTPAGFCTRCGRPLQTGDGFCRQCGAPVRR